MLMPYAPLTACIDAFFEAFDGAGFSQCSTISLAEGDDGSIEVTWIAVHAECRGRGYGSGLLSLLTRIADEHQLELVIDPVTEQEAGGAGQLARRRAWYERHGFRLVDARLRRAPARYLDDQPVAPAAVAG
jgi:ribosomal protein S18 acetylase RimI-like enzyme